MRMADRMYNLDNQFERLKKKNAELEAKLKHVEGNCINKTCVVLKDKEDCVAKILELEKENLYYKDIVEINSAEWEEQGQRIVALEKENAELKEKLKPENCLKSLAKSGLVKFTCENGNEHDQLTKAKVALRNVVDYLGQFCSDYPDCVIEAEKLLKENENV